MSWPKVKLRNLVVANYGKALKKEYRDENGLCSVFGSAGSVGFHAESLIDIQTIVVGRKGSVGKVIWAPNGGWIIDTAYYLTLIGDVSLDWRYLYYALQVANLGQKTITTSIPGLNRDDFYETEIPLPPLDEQKRIAAILDKADAIRQKRKQAIALADEFLHSVFLEMFGDIPAKVSPYPFVGCRGAVSASSGKSSKSVIADFKTEIPIYGGNGVNGYAHEFLYNEPVVVVGRVGQQCAITNLTEGPCWVTDNAIVIKITDEKKYDAAYLAHAFIHSPIRNSVTQLDLPFINQSMILDYPIPLPPIEEQRKFSAIRTKLKEHMSMHTAAFEQGEVQFNALSQKAFSGQL